jgi:hypothetical protein
MPGVQEQELLNDEEQEDDHRPPRVLEVLQYLPQAHRPQRNEVVSSRIWEWGAFSLIPHHWGSKLNG